MVDDDTQDPGAPVSFSGLGGERRFRARVAAITAEADPEGRWLAALRCVLAQVVRYDAAWLGRWDVGSGHYLPLLEDGDVQPLRDLFASDLAAADVAQLGFLRPGWPMLGHRILPLLRELPGWVRYLAPAGFHDGLGLGLTTSDGRHVGYLTLLTYRADVVPATAAALLHSVNASIADAVDRAPSSGAPDRA